MHVTQWHATFSTATIALCVASAAGQTDIVNLLITRGATVDIQDKVRLN